MFLNQKYYGTFIRLRSKKYPFKRCVSTSFSVTGVSEQFLLSIIYALNRQEKKELKGNI